MLRTLGGARYRPLAPDLRGHGAAAARRPISFAALVDDVLAVGGERFALGGYSLGGRIALQVVLAHPERVSRLVLVSTTAGLEAPGERAARRAADAALAARMEGMAMEPVARAWAAQPLFAGQPAAVAAAAHADRLRNDPRHLAAALRAVGTGAMEPAWGRLGALALPCRVLAGERDARFVALGRRLAAALGSAELNVVPGAGHAVPWEAPEAVAAALLAT